MFDDYYDLHEPAHTKYEAIKELKRRLNRKKVLNINVIENEHNKIKKENMGKGALLNNSMRTDDPSMKQFTKMVNKLLMVPHREDKFMLMKLNNTTVKLEKEEAARKKIKKNIEAGLSDGSDTE